MRCHYEVLEVPRDADDKVIKVAYRKLALKWHPDKNSDPSAKEQFQLLQQSYLVLSDGHERAWYDKHREQILRGRGTNYVDESINVFEYFTASCYQGFGDDAKSFYSVYSDVFKKIATEDIEFMVSEKSFDEIPIFGNSKSDYDKIVGPFYAHWLSYCTKKTFTWLCPHNIEEIRDRRILREVDKEMKKIVQKAKKERNDEVRALVAYVKKRDKRVNIYKKLLEEKAETNRLKQQQKRFDQLRKNQQEAEELKQTHNNLFNDDTYEAKLKQLQQDYASSSSELDDDDDDDDEDDDDGEYNDDNDDDVDEETVADENDKKDEDDVNIVDNDNEAEQDDEEDVGNGDIYFDELYCEVCNKNFKNQSSFKNHESSKKHKVNLIKLRKTLIKEDELFNGQSSGGSESEINGVADEFVDVAVDDTEEITLDSINLKSSKKKNKSKKRSQIKQNMKNSVNDEVIEEDAEIRSNLNEDNVNDQNWNEDSSSNKKNKKHKNKKSTVKLPAVTTPGVLDEPAIQADPTIVLEKHRKPSNKSVKHNTIPNLDVDITHTCVTCGSIFESKNKLFEHLNKKQHGVYIPKGTSTSSSGATADTSKSSKKRGKKN